MIPAPVQTNHSRPTVPATRALLREPMVDHVLLLAAGDIVELVAEEDVDYRVVHISAGKAWVRPILHGLQKIVPLTQLRLVGSGSGTVLLS